MRVCVEIYFKQIEDTIGELFPNKFGDKKHGAYERAKDSPNRTVVLVWRHCSGSVDTDLSTSIVAIRAKL